MTFLNRIRFFFGVLFVLALVGLLVLYLNNAMSTVHATAAELGADTATVGVDYPGLVTKQNVTQGDKVSKGQTLFVVNSPQLATDIAAQTVKVANLPFSVEPRTGNILVKAGDAGVVEKVDYQTGSYVPGGAVVATIDTVGTLYISGHFHLSPPDYARLRKGNIMNVTFPDNGRATATVYNVSLVKDGNIVDTVVKARLKGADVSDFRFPIGTPVDASLKLTQRTWYQDVTNFVRRLFKPSVQ